MLPLEDRQEQRCSSAGSTRAETSRADTSLSSCRRIDCAGGKHVCAIRETVRTLTALSQSQITNDSHWLDDTGVHRDGPCRWKCVAELNHRSSLLSPFNCSIRHTVNRTARLYTVLLSSRILEDKFTSPCPCPRTTKSLKIVKDFAFCKQSVICDP